MLRSLVGSEMCIRDRNSTASSHPEVSKEADGGSSQAGKLAVGSNFYLFLASTTPMVPTHQDPTHGLRFALRDVWRFYDAPYGFPVPIVSDGVEREVYYNPFLSAIQLWLPGAEADENPVLAFEFHETETPFLRPPMVDRLNELAASDNSFGKLLVDGTSADVAPCSWFAISWYPIVCGPQGARSTQGAILTYHALTVPLPGDGLPVVFKKSEPGAWTLGSAGEKHGVHLPGSMGEDCKTGSEPLRRIIPLSEVDPQHEMVGDWGLDKLLQLASVRDLPGAQLIFLTERAECPINRDSNCWAANTPPETEETPGWVGQSVALPMIGYLPYKLNASVWYSQWTADEETGLLVQSKKCVPPYFMGRAATHMINIMNVVHPDKVHVEQYTGGSNNLFGCVCELCKQRLRRNSR
eukprot:TRINITY_DN49667_c0_g1_i1.p1 TRINITY_DN49667_c0_g1~~TRINITY_DN49667_c0_g1_i1.p1  ORF type:complete len:410 (-),score=50.18 TRINITY_DN49667_c0_g1_i1:177-1406(-)